MIATLTGKVAEKLAERVVIDVQGVGYGVLVTIEDYGQLKANEIAKLYIHEHIREDAHDLFGFMSPDTLNLFEQLLSVNGVGPKMALSLLSVGTVGEVRAAIAAGNFKFIQAANGVGRKVAERIVVDLKDKVGLVNTADSGDLFTPAAAAQKDEAVQALVSLGFSAQDAVAALRNVDPDLPSEQRVKQALRTGGSHGG